MPKCATRGQGSRWRKFRKSIKHINVPDATCPHCAHAPIYGGGGKGKVSSAHLGGQKYFSFFVLRSVDTA